MLLWSFFKHELSVIMYLMFQVHLDSPLLKGSYFISLYSMSIYSIWKSCDLVDFLLFVLILVVQLLSVCVSGREVTSIIRDKFKIWKMMLRLTGH